MPKLILIKHAKPTVIPGEPPEAWPLSDEGKRQAAALAERLREYAPAVVVASDEEKAAETGRILAAKLGVPFETSAGVREHDRSNVPQMQTREFISYMALLFKKPGEQVLGLETADEAYDRFSNTIRDLEAAHGDKTIAVVSHGTVLALHLGKIGDEDPFLIWRRMGLPSFAVVEWNRVLEEVDRLD